MSELICIRCPIGCLLQASAGEDGSLLVTGNKCPRGREYAAEELTCPRRILTCLVKAEGSSEPLSVKTSCPIPKAQMAECAAAIKALKLSSPIAIGTVVARDICSTGADVVVSLHCDSYSNESVGGMRVYYYNRNNPEQTP
ncbi:MAG: DUF1667 domain-containing protein, partial [Christensenellaceae bacterium]|nr:DUF1667 domain-containing protein [Christensenellaceae bacterium]